MSSPIIFTYNINSAGAKKLSEALDWPLYARASEIPADCGFVLNWGSGYFNSTSRHTLNRSDAVSRAVNKVAALTAFKRNMVRAPSWITSIDAARTWLRNGGALYARVDLEGHDGQGIYILTADTPFVVAPLYTYRITDVQDEYRLTVFEDRVLATQKKVPVSSRDPASINYDIRTTEGGWGFDVVDSLGEDVNTLAVAACRALDLNFGGVDIVLQKRPDGGVLPYVLEVNTAPVLTPYVLSKFKIAVLAAYKEWEAETATREDVTGFSIDDSGFIDLIG